MSVYIYLEEHFRTNTPAEIGPVYCSPICCCIDNCDLEAHGDMKFIQSISRSHYTRDHELCIEKIMCFLPNMSNDKGECNLPLLCKMYTNIDFVIMCFCFQRALADLNKDGKMDRQEFSIAMKLIKLKLQGQPLPDILPPIMKHPSVLSPLISARFGNHDYSINIS